MTVFDIMVAVVVGIAAIGGFSRGLVQEILSLAAWVLAALAIHYLHNPLTAALQGWFGYGTPTVLLAFALLLLIPYAAMKVIAGTAGSDAKNSMLGPIDRVLGFGFGAVKGALITVFAFSVLLLGYDNDWGFQGRPAWIQDARTYPAVNASADALVQMIRQRRTQFGGRAADPE